MIEFSLNNGSNIPFVPNMSEILKYKDGNLGISENIMKNTVNTQLSMFNLSDSDKQSFINNINNNNPMLSLEKAVMQSLYETNMPIIASLNSIPKILSELEIICAKSLGLLDSSLNPFYNKNSITYQLNDKKNIQKLNDINKYNKIDELTQQKFDVNKNTLYDIYYTHTNPLGNWKTISEFYSTGIKYNNIFYSTTYTLLTKKKPNSDINTSSGSNNNLYEKVSPSGSQYYDKTDFASAVSDIAVVILTLSNELIPNLDKIISYLSNPSKIIIDKISEILSKCFEFIDKKILRKLSNLFKMKNKKDKDNYLSNNPDLKKYAYVNTLGDVVYLGEGAAFINFLNTKFGINFSGGNINTNNNKKENPLFKFIINLIVTPIKIVKNAIETIINKFKNINIDNIKDTINYIVSFKYITDAFKFENISEMMGFKINKDNIKKSKNHKKTKNKNSSDNNDKSDYNYITFPLLSSIGILNQLEFETIFQTHGNQYTNSIFGFFGFFEGIFKKLCSFIYDMFNIPNSMRNIESFLDKLKSSISDINNIGTDITNSIDRYTIKFQNGKIFKNLTLSEVEEMKNMYPNVIFNLL